MVLSWLTNLSWFAYGTRAFTRGGYERAAAGFDNSAILASGRHAGKLVVVTGANSGLGFAASAALAAAGADVLMVCRSKERGEAAAAAVRAAAAAAAASGGSASTPAAAKSGGGGESGAGEAGKTEAGAHRPGAVEVAVCDVSSLASIGSFAEGLLASGRAVHALVNNAGVLLAEKGVSADGYDLSFATNTLGGLALAARLLPALQRAPGSRVVFVSSGGMYTAPLRLGEWDDASGPFDGVKAYSQDKRRQVAQAEELGRRWGPLGVKVVSMHPGWADTEGVRTSLPGFANQMGSRLRTPEQGADTIVWLALADEGQLEPGAFYLDRAPAPKHLRFSGTDYAPSEAARLVDGLLAAAGLGAGGAAAAEAAAKAPRN